MLAFLVFLFEALFVASKMLETDYDYTVEEASDMLESGRYAMLSEREQLDYATAYMNATDETTASIQDEVSSNKQATAFTPRKHPSSLAHYDNSILSIVLDGNVSCYHGCSQCCYF